MVRRTFFHHVLCLVGMLLLCSAYAKATDTLVWVKGYVYDITNNQPLVNVNVVEANMQIGTSTDVNGFFAFRVPAKNIYLCVTHVGYDEKRLSIANVVSDSLLDIKLTKLNVLLDEVNIIGPRCYELNTPEMGVLFFSKKDIKSIPVMFGEGDVIKALQTQTGVSAGAEGFSGMYVRGGNDDENLYMLDGVPIYKIMHLGGLFSAINVEAIQDVKFYKSSFPPHYGGRLSSVLDVCTREGDMFAYHGSVMLGLTSVNMNMEGPIVKGKTSFATSVRRSWLEALIAPSLAIMNRKNRSKGEEKSGRYAFTDVNVKIKHIFNNRSLANLMLYFGNDYLKIGNRTFMDDSFYFLKDNMIRMKWGNMLVAGKWMYHLNEKIKFDVSLSYLNYTSLLQKNVFESDNREEDINYKELSIKKTSKNGICDMNGSVHLGYFVSNKHYINLGTNYTRHYFLPELNNIQTVSMDTEASYQSNDKRLIANEMAFYAEDDWNISDFFRLKAGLRFCLLGVDETTYHTLEPRISFRIALSDQLSLKSSYSRMNQFVQQISDSYISLPTDYWMPINRKFKPLKSDLVSAGLYYEYLHDYFFSIEGYYKYMHNLLEYKEGYAFMPASVGWDQKLTQGRGYSYGIELTTEKKSGKLTGMLGYGLLWSERQFAELNRGKRFPSKYDNRHKINILVNYKLNSILELSGGWTYITGNRMTIMFEDYLSSSINGFDPLFAPSNPFQDEWVNYYEGKNNVRLPAYHRLDLGMNIYQTLKNGRMGIWNISIWNAYCRMNPIAIRTHTLYSDRDKRKISPQFQTIGLFPLIPSVSYTYKF